MTHTLVASVIDEIIGLSSVTTPNIDLTLTSADVLLRLLEKQLPRKVLTNTSTKQKTKVYAFSAIIIIGH